MFECKDLMHIHVPGAEVIKGHGKICKECKARKTREQTLKKNKEKKATLLGRFETAQDWQQFNTDKYNINNKHRHLPPKEIEFSSREEYLKAIEIEKAREETGGEGRKSKNEYYETDNAKKRQKTIEKNEKDTRTYEEKKQDSKRRKLDRDNAAKRIRIRAPIAEGMGRCCTGPHDVPLEEIEFCPVADLGIEYNGLLGKRLRKYCKRHFSGYINSMRKHNNKIERREYNRKGLVKYRTTEKYKEYIQKYEVQANRRISSMRQQAKTRNIEYNLSIQKEEEIVGIDTVCYYCDRRNNPEHRGLYKSSSDSVERPLGPDRLDSNKNYTDENVVPCCSQCNISKCNLSVDDFVKACRNVINFQHIGVPTKTNKIQFMDKQKADSFSKYKNRAKEKNRYFELTPKLYEELRRQSCYSCGLNEYKHIGIDRFDSSQGYTIENMRSCCSACNYLKRHYTFDEFVEMCHCVCKVFK